MRDKGLASIMVATFAAALWGSGGAGSGHCELAKAVEPVPASMPSDIPGLSSPAPLAPDGVLLASFAPKTGTSPSDAQPGACPDDMVEVEGDYCPTVEQKCLRWLDPDKRMRCAEFAPTPACTRSRDHKHFCMDRFEYPNKLGEKPVVMKTWWEAKATCESQGKRLCTESEWTLACEGQEMLPYPYGYTRSKEACNIDKPHPDVDEAALADPKRRDAEAARLDQRDPSGARESCVSPFGVHDMTGNVDEWVVNERGRPYQSSLKGGYWGPVRTRCRPATIAHNEDFSFYQIGFRCCGEAGAGQGPKAAPSGTQGGEGKGQSANTRPAELAGS